MTLTADGRNARHFTDDDHLAAITRAERAEAAHEVTRGRLTNAQVELHIVTGERDQAVAKLTAVRELHDQWGASDVHVLDPTAMWEAIRQILNPEGTRP